MVAEQRPEFLLRQVLGGEEPLPAAEQELGRRGRVEFPAGGGGVVLAIWGPNRSMHSREWPALDAACTIQAGIRKVSSSPDMLQPCPAFS